MKIGIFDSGLGGISILKEIIKVLPQYDYIYLGDNARVPYGGRSKELIYQFTTKALNFLFSQKCNLVILACNTATATSLRKIQQEYLPEKFPGKKVLGVIKPAVEKVNETKALKVGIIGTYTTIGTKAFIREITKVSPKTKVFQMACPLLVPIIEEGEIDWLGLKMILKKYLRPLTKRKIDTLILACTHYGLIADKIQAVVGKNVNIITEGQETAIKLKDYLQRHPGVEKSLTKNRQREFFVTDLNERYKKIAQMFFGRKIELKLRPIS